DLLVSGVGEDAPAPDVELTPGDVLPGLGEHWVALDGAGATLPGEVDGCARQRPADAATAVPGTRCEADDRPDAVVGRVLVAALPRDRRAPQARKGGPGLDGAPAHGLSVEVRDESARRRRAGKPAVRLLLESLHALRDVRPALLRPVAVLELLALAVGRVSTIAEDRPQVLPGGLVRGHDPELPSRRIHPHPPMIGTTEFTRPR